MYTYRSSILLHPPQHESLSSPPRGSKNEIKHSVPPGPQDEAMNEELSSYMIPGSPLSRLTSGSKLDGAKTWKPSLIVVTGAFTLALLFTALLFFFALHMISLLKAPSHSKPIRNHTTNATAKSPVRFGAGLGSTGDAYGILFRDAVDREAQPCDNFYRFACGSWKRNHPHTTSRAENLRYFVTAAVARMREVKPEQADGEPIGKAALYLKACLAATESGASNDVKMVLAQAGLTWPDRSASSDFVSALFFMARRLALPVFFGVDLLHFEGSVRHILTFPLDTAFQSILRTLQEHIRSGNVVAYLRLAYDNMVEHISDDARFSEILASLEDMKEVFEDYLKASEKEDAFGSVTSLLRIAPMVSMEKWNSSLQRYFGESITEVDYVVVFDRTSITKILGLLKTKGEDRAKDILGCLAVHAAIYYTKTEIRESFFGSTEEARAQQERHCFGDVHGLFKHVVDGFLFNVTQEALAHVSELAHTIREEFMNMLRSGSLLRGQPVQYRQPTGFGKILALPETSKPLGSFFGRNVSSRPLQNRMVYAERLAKRPDMSVGTARRHTQDFNGFHLREQQGDADVSNLQFRLAPQHVFFPWFSTTGPNRRATLYAGIGTRMAAALYFDYMQRRPFGRSQLVNYHMCLASNAGDDFDVPFSVEVQAAVAGVYVAWRAYKRNVAADRAAPDAAAAADGELSAMMGYQAFFLFGCYLFCGDEDGERMCNVPAKENADFARVFRCGENSSMKPNKCYMFG
ncbi:hypothetical protein MRX96_058916 [Rhipicephalus microplus]